MLVLSFTPTPQNETGSQLRNTLRGVRDVACAAVTCVPGLIVGGYKSGVIVGFDCIFMFLSEFICCLQFFGIKSNAVAKAQ